MSNDDYNYVAEACSELLRGKDTGFSMNGYVTTEEQWKAAYKEQIGKTEDNIAIMSSDPTEWQITWTQIQTEVEKLKIELPLRAVRIERNHRLADTDWVVTKATETGVGVSTEWKTYRQALRDITKTVSSADDVVWPTMPS